MKKSLRSPICLLITAAFIFASAFTVSARFAMAAELGVPDGYVPLSGDEFDRGYDPAEIMRNVNPYVNQADTDVVARKPQMASAAGATNAISGITIKADTKSTGMGSWTPDTPYNLVERSEDWISFFTTDMTSLKAGDIIVWEDDLLGGALFNHIAIIVEVEPDFSGYTCADGNCPVNSDRPTGIDFVYRTTLQKKGSSSGHVCIWRNQKHGDDIAASAVLYTQNIIDKTDMTFNNEYNTIGWGWCYCYVVEMLLAAQDAEGRVATQIANERFSDVIDRTAAIYKPIQWAANNGIVNGFDDGTFKPEENCTRAQFVIMLWRMLGRPGAAASDMEGWTPFLDVSSDMSAYKAICWGSSAGIIRGYSDGTFKPDDPLTRGNIVTMIWRLKEKPEIESDVVFSDLDGTDPCYRPIRWAAAAGLVRGFSDGTFGSVKNCTRAQLAIILYRGVGNGLLDIVNEVKADDNTAPETPASSEPQPAEDGYFDEYGNYYMEDGYYDVYGNYHSYDEASGNAGEKSDDEGYTDEYGNYHIGNGYYDLYGNFHLYDGGYLDPYGNYHDYEY